MSLRVTILAVGKTGLGKSYTATLFGCDAKVAHDINSRTKNVTIHQCGEYEYIDTPGFDDETFINIIATMQKKNVNKLHTLFWFVGESYKTTDTLQNQAKFIEALAKDNTNNVWENVIVIYKGTYNTFNKDVIQGAIEEDKKNSVPILPVFLYDEFPLNSPIRKQSDEELRELGIYKEEELRNMYKKIIKEKRHKDHPIRIVFNDEICTKCGLRTDRRFAGKFPCHTKETIIRDAEPRYTEHYHNGVLETEYDKEWEILWEIPKINLVDGLGETPLAAPSMQNTTLLNPMEICYLIELMMNYKTF
ncbi:8764_t:CDS:2 [Ambispora leptoticha]|uniref:8764_t:CDS:1 n=1 Tax=Ambispora leptoticha TaxID=144679 RepID=A0A9N8W7J1_9GLOM|nr:8764_t:CDS:2 [Ambispora leptoticha]